MIRWKKHGLLFQVNQSLPWSMTHAQLPIVFQHSEADFSEIYFSTRDSKNKSRGALIKTKNILAPNTYNMQSSPIIDLGNSGDFDDMGAMPTSLVEYNGDTYMYYIGWNIRNTVPYYNSIGLAIREKGSSTFQKISAGPLFDRNYKEPYFNGTAWVMREKNLWKMWYLSCTEWITVNGKKEPRYLIRYAESNNGIDWNRDGIICIDYKNNTEAIAGATVTMLANGSYYMLYCFRDVLDYRTSAKNAYKIGSATSLNGIDWQRDKEPIWDKKSGEDWESTMQAYPCMFEQNGKTWMLYNGNGFGQSGFGLAEMVVA